MEELAARAMLVAAPDVGEGLTTSVSRSEIEEVLASEGEPIELVLDIARFSDGEPLEPRSVAVSWERSDLERLLEQATGDEVILTFDRDALQQAVETDVEAHGIRETVLALAVAATAATGAAATASAEPGPFLGSGAAVTTSVGPDDRALPRTSPATLSPDDRALPRTSPAPAPTLSPDDRALPRTSPAPEPTLSPDDRALPRTSPAPEPTLSPDDRAVPRMTPAPEPTLSPDDRAVPRGTPVAPPATGTASDPGVSWAPNSSETVVLAGAIALAIAGAFFLVGGRRVRPGPA